VDAIAVVSLGNSSVRCALWSRGALVPAARVRTPDLADAVLFAPAAGEVAPEIAAVASVVPDAEPALEERIRADLGLVPRYLNRDLAVPLKLEVDEPARVGADRLAATLAAQRSSGAAVVVDFGTAITVDAVTADGRFLGGAIMPGPELAREGLAAGTAGVIVAARIEAVPPPGRNTREAVCAAATHGLAGAVDRLVEMTARKLGGGAALIATGGGAELLAPLCRSGLRVVPDLVLQGLVLAAQENMG
jgi:type III pantothenate kinase